jgi:transcription elongation factor Elf1
VGGGTDTMHENKTTVNTNTTTSATNNASSSSTTTKVFHCKFCGAEFNRSCLIANHVSRIHMKNYKKNAKLQPRSKQTFYFLYFSCLLFSHDTIAAPSNKKRRPVIEDETENDAIDVEGLDLEDFEIHEYSSPQYDSVPKMKFDIQVNATTPTNTPKKQKLPSYEEYTNKEEEETTAEVPETLRKLKVSANFLVTSIQIVFDSLKILKEAREEGLITEEQFVNKQKEFLQSLKFG